MLGPLLPEQYVKLIEADGINMEQWSPGSEDIAWKGSGVALKALDALEGSNVAIVGGDVAHLVRDKLRYRPESWSITSISNETAGEYVRRSHRIAREFITSFYNGTENEPLFIFQLSAVVV